jgi:hypothetical protein
MLGLELMVRIINSSPLLISDWQSKMLQGGFGDLYLLWKAEGAHGEHELKI